MKDFYIYLEHSSNASTNDQMLHCQLLGRLRFCVRAKNIKFPEYFKSYRNISIRLQTPWPLAATLACEYYQHKSRLGNKKQVVASKESSLLVLPT